MTTTPTFVIAAFVSTSAHARLAANCILSVHRFYSDARIVVVLDSGSLPLKPMHDGQWVLDKVHMVLPNPYPNSGEYGALCVACTHPCIPQGPVAVIHDGTVLRRPFTPSELALAKDSVLPMWNTKGYYWNDQDDHEGLSCTQLVDVICRSPAVSEGLRHRWSSQRMSPHRTVVFGVMVLGSSDKLRDVWNTGMAVVAPFVTCRLDRCRIERLLALAILVAGVGRVDSRHGKLQSVCGCIIDDYPFSFTPKAAFATWRDPAAADTGPVLLKRWQGR